MPDRVYLDYGATSPLDPRVLEAMMPYLMGEFGNPSSLYSEGKRAAQTLQEARETVAASIGCRDPHDIVFTSGATESNNAAIAGIAHARFASMKKSLGPGHVICPAFEHKAVLEPMARLKRLGHEVTFLGVGRDGMVDPDELDAAIRPDTLLVSIMFANNEIGTVQPIEELAEVAHSHGVPLHCDAVAAYGKIPVDVRHCGADSITITSHKICGPKGIGALYLSKKVPFEPLVVGGGQERGLRSGTSNVAGAVGFAEAAKLAVREMDAPAEVVHDSTRAGANGGVHAGVNEGGISNMCEMRDALVKLLTSDDEGEGARVSSEPSHGTIRTAVDITEGDATRHLPQLVPLLMEGIGSQELVFRLDDAGFAISGGSACTASQAGANHVLASIGVQTGDTLGFARITMGRFTTMGDIEAFAAAFRAIACETG